ncbi:MAG: RDD family protein [Terriglobales bacterium]
MECPLCGELCTCAAGRGSSSARGAEDVPSHVAVLIDPESLDVSEQSFEAPLEQPPAPASEPSVREVPVSEAAAAPAPEAPVAVAVSELPPVPSAPPPPLASSRAPFYRPEDASAWRQEVSSRVDNFRSRRRGRYDPNSSLSLNFDTDLEVAGQPQAQPQFNEAPKVIEFPRPAAPPPPLAGMEELAEPVVEKPRILEAEEPLEEVAAPVAAPPIASITLEPASAEVAAYGQEREILLWLAPPVQRVFAGLVDALVVATATGLFGLIFLHMAGVAPSGRMAAGFALALPGFFWALYQYLFLVYGGTTPGLQMTGLRLTTFDGDPVPRRQRRWRALAMIVSYISLGLGFLWAIVDEDGLGWHDRITRTCVRE